MHSSTKKAAEPKRLTKNGKVYGDLLSAEEKKKLVLQKKKDKKAKKVRKSAQQTIPYVEMCRDGICKVNSRLYTKTIRFNDINYQLAQNEDKTAIFENWCDFLNYFDSSIFVQFSFINQRTSISEFKKQINIPEQDDEFNDIRSCKTSSRRATTASSSASTLLLALRPTPCAWRRPSWIGLRRTSSTISKPSV